MERSSSYRTRTVMGCQIIDEPAEHLADILIAGLTRAQPKLVICMNPHSYITARDDQTFSIAIAAADGLICDGIGMSIAARLTTGRSLPRITGYQFFTVLSQALEAKGNGRVYFLGGHPDWASPLCARYRKDFPNIGEVAHYSPPFKAEFDAADISAMTQHINAFQPDLLWVGLGSPKQEKILHALSESARFGIGAPIGQVFDFYSGRLAPAPALVHKLGIEWAFRLVRQPKRLGARTFKSAPRFLWMMAKHAIRRGPG